MECFKIVFNEIENRLDSHFYKPEFKALKSRLLKLNHKRLGEVINFANETWNQKDLFGDEFPYIEISGIDINTGEIKEITNYKKENAPSRAKMIVRGNDIIVSTTRPNRGAISFIDKSKDGFIASTGFAILRDLISKEIDRFYLLHTLRTGILLAQMLQRSSGGNYPAITPDELAKIIIPIPLLATQKQVVEIMQSAYAQKKQREQEADELLESIDEYMLEELGIKFPKLKDKKYYAINVQEIKGKRLDPLYHQPKFGSIEEALNKGKYKLVELDKVGDFIAGYAFSSQDYVSESGVKLLTIKNITKTGINFNDVTLLPRNYINKFASFSILRSDIVIAMTGATIGKASIFDLDENVLLNQRVGIIRCKGKVNNIFINAILNSNFFKQEIIRRSVGGAQPNISEKEIISIVIPFPSLEIQNKIADGVKRRMSQAQDLRVRSNELVEEAKQKVEKIILG